MNTIDMWEIQKRAQEACPLRKAIDAMELERAVVKQQAIEEAQLEDGIWDESGLFMGRAPRVENWDGEVGGVPCTWEEMEEWEAARRNYECPWCSQHEITQLELSIHATVCEKKEELKRERRARRR